MTEKAGGAELREKLNGETAKLPWSELQRHFANGAIIKVTVANDLVDVAVAMAQDDTAVIAAGMEAGTIVRASEEDARQWEQNGQSLWVVVVAPWVLVQEVVEH